MIAGIKSLDCEIKVLTIEKQWTNKTIFKQVPFLQLLKFLDGPDLVKLNISANKQFYKVVNMDSSVYVPECGKFLAAKNWIVILQNNSIFKFPMMNNGMGNFIMTDENLTYSSRRESKSYEITQQLFSSLEQVYIGRPF